MVTLETIEVAVDVTTVWMPPMSFAMRDCTSPVRVRVKKRERQPLQMAVHGRAEIVHDSLPDDVREPRLRNAQHAGRDRDCDQPDDELVEESRLLLGQGHVEDRADQKRGDHPEPGRDEDEREHGSEAPLIGPEEGDDPAQVGAPHRWIRGTLDRFVAVERVTPVVGRLSSPHRHKASGGRVG